jgi:hypothetical protein
MTKNARKKIQLKILLSFCDQLQLLLKASINDVQATEEAFSSQKRTSRTTKNESYYHFFYFCPPVSGSRDTNYPDPIRIRIHNTAFFFILFVLYTILGTVRNASGLSKPYLVLQSFSLVFLFCLLYLMAFHNEVPLGPSHFSKDK